MSAPIVRAEEFSQRANRTSGWILLLAGTVTVFVLSGVITGWRELSAGLLHLFAACRSVLRMPGLISPALTSAASISVFLALAIGVSSAVLDGLSARGLLRRLRTVRCPADAALLAVVSEVGLQDRVDLVEDEAPFAFAAGFLQPRIIVSSALTALLDADELRAVLRHESWHARRRDPLRHLLARATGRALFFIPLVSDLWRRYQVESELAADASAVSSQGRGPLARALLKVVDAAAAGAPAFLPSGFLSMLDVRISYLLHPEDGVTLPGLRWPRVFVSGLILALVLGLIPMHTPPSFLDVFSHAGLFCYL